MSITFISAGAGSGKTTRLMDIIADAIARGVSPDRVVATTFTVKAAEELKGRIQQRFLASGDFDRANAASAIMVGTINSVCGRLLSLFAFDAGMSPELTVLDEDAAAAFLQKAIDATIDDARIEEFNRLERRFGITRKEKTQWQEHVRKIIDAARFSRIDTASLPGMATRNADALTKAIGAPLVDHDRNMQDLLEDVIPTIEKFQSVSPQANTGTYLDSCKALLDGLRTNDDSWKNWLRLENGGAGKNCGDCADKVAELAALWKTHTRFHADIRRYLELVFDTAASVMTAYDKLKTLSGMLDFTDQEAKLYALLEKESVRERLAERMDLLVVDEFQDTSPIQLALFVKLASLSGETFFVGDVKQSIYGFRGSDSALMEGILEEFGKRGTKVEILPTSYRSRPSLVSLANAIFVPAFADELSADRVALKSHRAETTGPAFMHMVLSGSKKEIRAAQLAGGIIKLHDSNQTVCDRETKTDRAMRWSDIAVLARSQDDVDEITASLKASGIPLRTSGTGLLATPEANLALAALRRLNDSHDTLASAELLALTQGLSPEAWLEERLKWLKTGEGAEADLWRCKGPDANPVLQAIEEIRPLVDQLGPSALLDAVLARSGIDGYLLSWTPEEGKARERLSNLEAIRAIVREYEETGSDGARTLAGLILHLGTLAGGGDPLPESAADGVSVMTWHKAKGLEWPVVVLHGSWKETHDVAWNSIRALRGKTLNLDDPLADAWIRFWPWPFGDMKKLDSIDAATDPIVAELRRTSVKEERRLLYVGVTRARDLLVVAAMTKPAGADASCASLGPSKDLYAQTRKGTTAITLPDGAVVPYECASPEAAEPKRAATSGRAIKWYDTACRPKKFPAARLIPSDDSSIDSADDSSLATPLRAGRVVRIPVSLTRTPGAEIRELGNLYHAAFAFFANNESYAGPHPFSPAMRESALAMARALKELWPQSVFHTELTVRADIGDGRYIDARLDLLVETDDGFYVVDHKLTEKPDPSPDETIAKHAGQLAFYRKAVEASSTKPVLGLWISQPQDGALVEGV